MPAVALIGAAIALVVLLPARIVVHRRRTGSSGVVLARAAPGAPRRAAALLGTGTLLVGIGPAAHLIGLEWDWTPGNAFITHAAGILLLVAGLAWAAWSQQTMAEHWRVGQDESERPELVTTGPFGRMRHPIYTGMVVLALGVTMTDPTYPGAVGVVVLALGVRLQALRVEEPHLRALHGAEYEAWARRTGRFLPPMT
ncbi:isoprenylcysteine carboxylmethyltransferase family protein [Patulibacter sp. NPDC049589]|uniref:methyltransferase family protein n=1 Tax=Patulibacter sp. NPDC049589 TaxID=3154731 RepID=UPI00342109B6